MSSEYFECHCHSPEHTLSFKLFDDEPVLYGYVLLLPLPFFSRLWNGIKYICGYTCKYGHFDEFIFDPKDTERMIELFTKYKELQKDSV